MLVLTTKPHVGDKEQHHGTRISEEESCGEGEACSKADRSGKQQEQGQAVEDQERQARSQEARQGQGRRQWQQVRQVVTTLKSLLHDHRPVTGPVVVLVVL